MRFRLKGLRRLLTALGMLILLVLALLGGLLWATLPPGSQSARIPGLTAPVEIGFDADGIPRIRAANALDAAAALGFVHARDRMFQMDLMRRNASGRLSEIAGPPTLRLDRTMRTLGLRRHAVQDLATLPADARATLEAYARGVNAWIQAKGRLAAPEFLLLGAPEPWQPVDSLLWGKTMGLWLSMNWRQELSRQALLRRFPRSMIDELWPGNAQLTAATDAATTHPRFADAAAALMRVLPAFPGIFTLPPSASNEWAVDGNHTATGAPLLAGDPHLGFGFPAIWYLARIDTPQGTLAGATAPGVPFLVIGHNGKIAWTFTTTGADVQDLFLDSEGPFSVHEERIRIKGQPDELLLVRETRHGPVISDLGGKDSPVMAVAMGNLLPDDTAAAGLLALNRATSVAEAGKAAALISSPVQNLLVADRQTIGLFLTGRVPVRRQGDGGYPVPGDGAHDWTGFLSGEQLPHSVGPPSGRLVNANEPIALPGFDPVPARDGFADWRARRIHTMLAATERHTAAGFAAMQVDIQSAFARQVLPALRTAVPDALSGWDGAMRMDAAEPLIFNAWVDRFYAAVLDKAGIPAAAGGPIADFVAFVLSPAGAHWCGGDCTALLKQSLDAANRDLTARYGADQSAWRWGEVHQAVFAHPILRNFPLLASLTTATIATPGDDSTVNRGGTNTAFESVHGASYRGVYDLSDLDRSLFVMAPGQAGHPLSRHARDFLTRWRDGATITLGPTASATTATVRLEP